MGYIHCNGRTYGIIIKRNFLETILVNLPLINLLYTKKIRVNITRRTKSGAPVHGIFNDFRVYKNEKAFRIFFKVPEIFSNVLIHVDDKTNPGNTYSKDIGEEYDCIPNAEYSEVILL